MLIVNVTTSDPAGAIINQCKAVNRNFREHQARVICTRDLGFGWNTDVVLERGDDHLSPCAAAKWPEAEALIKSADVLVLHKPIELSIYDGGEFINRLLTWAKKTVVYHHGEGSLRLKAAEVLEWEKDIPGLRIVVTPDLLKAIPGAHYIPNVIDETILELTRLAAGEKLNPPEVSQCTTGNWEKDTAEINEARKFWPDHSFKLIYGLKHPECLLAKARSSIGIDHFQGYYGLSGLEYCALGIPCIVGLDGWNIRHIRDFFGSAETPFEIVPLQWLAESMNELLSDSEYRQERGERALKFMNETWTAAVVAGRLIELYQKEAA